jgi:hypothetical protein
MVQGIFSWIRTAGMSGVDSDGLMQNWRFPQAALESTSGSGAKIGGIEGLGDSE